MKKNFFKINELADFTVIRDYVRRAKKIYGRQTAYRQYESPIMEASISFAGLNDNVDALGTALFARGMQGRHCALLGETSIEWMESLLALTGGNCVVVPLDRELNAETMAYQINFSDCEYIFCSGKCMKKLLTVLPLCPNIKGVIVMRHTMSRVELPEDCLLLEDLIDEGYKLILRGDESYRNYEIDPDALAIIVFTSGTTGANKGVMLSHKNIVSCNQGCRYLVTLKSPSMSVLPVNHTYELVAHLISCIYEGVTVCINDDLKHVLPNLEHFAPRMSCMVPAMVELMARKIRKEIEVGGLKNYFEFGVKMSNFLRMFGIDKRKKFFKSILSAFGGKLEMIICGGAPLSAETEKFFDTIGITIYNGYGITECAPVVAVNGIKIKRKGSVGQVLPTCTVRIDNPNDEGNGEILVKGDSVMKGYYKNPEDTAKVLTEDGWFHTGDIGYLDKDNFLFINGRIKNLIILTNGKNVSPEEVEDHLQHKIPYIEECVVMENNDGTGICAMCYLSPDYCKENNLTTKDEKLAHLLKDIQIYNRGAESFKRIADTYIVDTPFEKTTTHKIKRFLIKKEEFASK